MTSKFPNIETVEGCQELLDTYKDVISDHKRLVREIDVIINGEDGAAKQASLCDLVSQIKAMKVQNELWVPKVYSGSGNI